MAASVMLAQKPGDSLGLTVQFSVSKSVPNRIAIGQETERKFITPVRRLDPK
jgi:hypothetical protein